MLDHVVVLGAGIAGLTAARAAAGMARRVTLVERDRLARGERPGVPQARHVHALLTRGRRELEHMFPGLGAELVAAGGHDLDWTEQRIRGVMGWSPRFTSGLRSILCTRDLLEATVRGRVLALPGVVLAEGREVVGLTGDADRVRGAVVRHARRHGHDDRADRDGTSADTGDLLDADLVVDATGRGSHAPAWLAALGVPAPRETVVASHLAYASRVYAMPPGFDADWRLLAVRQSMPSSRAAVLYPVEGERWFVTLTGQGADAPPHDDAGFAAFAASIEAVGEGLDGARPLGSIAAYRRTENRWRHWEELDRWPEGVLVLGDAQCAFNPVYGQGMTIATIQATLLRRALRAGAWPRGGARAVQRAAARTLRDPWLLATQEDFRFPDTIGERSRATRAVHAYSDRVLQASTRDKAVTQRFFEVTQLVRAGPALATAPVAARVLAHALRPVP